MATITRGARSPRERWTTHTAAQEGLNMWKPRLTRFNLKDEDLGRAGPTCNSDNTAREREKEKRSNSDILKKCRSLHGVRKRPTWNGQVWNLVWNLVWIVAVSWIIYVNGIAVTDLLISITFEAQCKSIPTSSVLWLSRYFKSYYW